MKTKIHKRIGTIFLFLTLCLILLPATALGAGPADGAAEAKWQTQQDGEWQTGTFAQAIEGVYGGGTVQLLTDVVLPETTTIQKSMTVTSENPDKPKQITRGDKAKGYLLNIEVGKTQDNLDVSVILKDVILDGGSKNGVAAARAFIAVKGGELTLENGAVIRNNNNATENGAGGGICIISGTVQMNDGAVIENCFAYSGGGVALVEEGTSLEINGGTVRDCKATGYPQGGGAIYLQSNAAVSMNRGYLQNNRSVNNGGAVFIYAGTFTQSGGTIAGNDAPYGGGVYVNTSIAAFIMSDGSIQSNTARYGAGAFINHGVLDISGGEVIENVASGEADARGGAMFVAPRTDVFLSGTPVITGNTSTKNGKDDILLDWGLNNPAVTIQLKGKLGDGAEIGIMICDIPDDGEEDTITGQVVVVGRDYTVTEDDLSKFTYTSYSHFLSLNDNGEIIVQKAIPVESISVTPETLSLTAGASSVITAVAAPDDATYPEISWSSSDPAVATVDANGRVTAVKPGTAVITAAACGDDTVNATCTVTVTRPSSATRYPIIVEDSAHGQVESDRTRAEEGATVTLTVTPDEGWKLNKLTVTDSRGNEIAVRGRGNGRYTFTMPRSQATVKAVFSEITPNRLPFTDVPAGAWYESAVRYVYENGLMTGTSATTFGPNDVTTRAQIVTILWRIAGSPAVNDPMDFSDVPAGAYYTEAVRWAASEGIVGGYGNGTFGPNDPITREQFAAILYRYAQVQGGGFTGAWAFPLEYEDAEQVSDWAYESLCWMTMKGIISGTSSTTLSPQGWATRAQAAAMLMRFCQNSK